MVEPFIIKSFYLPGRGPDPKMPPEGFPMSTRRPLKRVMACAVMFACTAPTRAPVDVPADYYLSPEPDMRPTVDDPDAGTGYTEDDFEYLLLITSANNVIIQSD